MLLGDFFPASERACVALPIVTDPDRWIWTFLGTLAATLLERMDANFELAEAAYGFIAEYE